MKNSKFNKLFNFILYNSHYAGLLISSALAYVTYDLSQANFNALKQSFVDQEYSRSVLRTNLLLNRAFSVSSVSVTLEEPKLLQQSREIYDETVKFFKQNKKTSEVFFNKYDAYVQELGKNLNNVLLEIENGKAKKSTFAKYANSYEFLSVNMTNDEVLSWGKILKNNDVVLAHQEKANNILKIIHLIFTVSIFLIMYFANKKREDDLKIYESEQLHRLLFSSLSEGVMLINDKGNITAVNQSSQNILGMGKKDLLGKNLFKLFEYCLKEDQSYYEKTENPFYRITHSGEALNSVLGGVYRQNFSFLWLSINSQPIKSKAKNTKGSSIISLADITEKIERQSLIEKQREEMVKSARLTELGEMAGGVAHEVNNPLAVISAEAEDLLDIIEDEGEVEAEDVEKASKMIIKTTRRISKIVKGLLNFAREGDADPFVVTKLSEIMEDTLDLCERKLVERKIDISINNFSNKLQVECRATPISQVIMNLINNASDAIKENEEKWIKISVEDQGKNVKISVTDSGNGIPKEIRDKIFSPFFTTKAIGKGTGLGMSVSKGIVESHGGKLEYDEKSLNTKFDCYLPKQQNKTPETEGAPAPA